MKKYKIKLKIYEYYKLIRTWKFLLLVNLQCHCLFKLDLTTDKNR